MFGKPKQQKPENEQTPANEQKPTERESLLLEANEFIVQIRMNCPFTDDKTRIEQMYENLQFLSDEKDEYISISYALEAKKGFYKDLLSLKKYGDLKSIPDKELPLYIELLRQELTDVVMLLKNALVDVRNITSTFLNELPDKAYYKPLRDEINNKLSAPKFSWAFLNELKEFNANFNSKKQKLLQEMLSANIKLIFPALFSDSSKALTDFKKYEIILEKLDNFFPKWSANHYDEVDNLVLEYIKSSEKGDILDANKLVELEWYVSMMASRMKAAQPSPATTPAAMYSPSSKKNVPTLATTTPDVSDTSQNTRGLGLRSE